MTTCPALILDRDGVINVDHGYVWRIEDFDFLPGIFDLARAAYELGWTIIVVTNQAGIGRGLYTEADFLRLTAWMQSVFLREGAPIRQVYFCPTHPEHGVGRYRVESLDRKPGPGMILRAALDHGLDLPTSVLVGDRHTDIAAGRSAGVGLNVLIDPQAAERTPMDERDLRVVSTLEQVIPLLTLCHAGGTSRGNPRSSVP